MHLEFFWVRFLLIAATVPAAWSKALDYAQNLRTRCQLRRTAEGFAACAAELDAAEAMPVLEVLDLSRNAVADPVLGTVGFFGTLPAAWAQTRQSLQSINLSSNLIHGSIPSGEPPLPLFYTRVINRAIKIFAISFSSFSSAQGHLVCILRPALQSIVRLAHV